MNDQEFFDLAMKACAGRCTDAERAELDAVLSGQPERKAEFAKLKADARLAREVLPIIGIADACAGSASGTEYRAAESAEATAKFPEYARERLKTKVRETLGRPEPVRPKLASAWGWILGLAAGTALILAFVIPMLNRPNVPVIQVAMLDTVGVVRGADTNEIGFLKQRWGGSEIRAFDTKASLDTWESNWPRAKVAAKVIYDRAAGEVRVAVRRRGAVQQRAFPVENDLGIALRQADEFIRE